MPGAFVATELSTNSHSAQNVPNTLAPKPVSFV